MSTKQPKQPKQAKQTQTLLSFSVLIGGQKYDAQGVKLEGETLDKELAGLAEDVAALGRAEEHASAWANNAARAGWKLAERAARLYGAYRVAGMDDAQAYAAIGASSNEAPGALIAAGVSKSSAQRYAAAGRAIAAGVTRKEGETVKAYAARVGGATKRAPRQKDATKETLRNAEKALSLLGDLRAAAAGGGWDKRHLDVIDTLATYGKTVAGEASKAVAAAKAGKAK